MAADSSACFSCGEPATISTSTGHPACAACVENAALELGAVRSPVDLRRLMASEFSSPEFMVPSLIPKGGITAIAAKAGHEKSLLLLNLAASRAAGCPLLDTPAEAPLHVLYLDFEMGPADLQERLDEFGWTTDHPKFDTLVSHLHYFQFPDLPPLDTDEGGLVLEELVEEFAADWIIVDTVSRVISGEENSSDTFRRFDRHTGRRLRRRGITATYLDHVGKDKSRGARGSSAKTDSVDTEWALQKKEGGLLEFNLTKGRSGVLPHTVTVMKVNDNGRLGFRPAHQEVPAAVVDIARDLDRLDVATDAPLSTAQQALKHAGRGRRRAWIVQAQQLRRSRESDREPPGNRPSGTFTGTAPEPNGTGRELDATATVPAGFPLGGGTGVMPTPEQEKKTHQNTEAETPLSVEELVDVLDAELLDDPHPGTE